MSETLYRIKTLEWKQIRKTSLWIAHTPFGMYLVFPEHQRFSWINSASNGSGKCENVELAKQDAEADLHKRISSMLQPALERPDAPAGEAKGEKSE